jgi:glycosyltransferase involved in cell wall biosynthesis
LIEHCRFFWWKQIQLPALAKKKGVTHLFCSDFFVPLYKRGLKTIAVLHDAFFWESPEHYHPLWLSLFHFLGIPAAKKADLLIVPTAYAKKAILAKEDFDASKIKVVWEANKTFVDQPILPNTIASPYFLHVGVLEKRKNLVRLVQAFAKVHAQYPNCKLVLVGNTPVKFSLNDAPAIQDTIDALGLQASVLQLGYLETAQLATIYHHAFAYCLSSLNEGFGLPILEAFYFRLPLICAKSSALPEVAGEAALYVNPLDVNEIADAMLQFIEQPTLREVFINKGQERLALFSWQKSAQEIYDLIKDC